MKNLSLLIILSVILSFHTADSFAEEQQHMSGAELMFVQNSKSVSFDKGTMTLNDVSPSTTFFSDRPERLAGHIPTTHFLHIWAEGSDSFKNDPPNANLSILGEKEGVTNIIVEISNPRLKDNNLTYDIKLLEGELPKEGGISSLFIDWWAAWGPGPRRYYGPYPRYYGPGPGVYCHRSYYTYGRWCHFGGPYYRPPLY